MRKGLMMRNEMEMNEQRGKMWREWWENTWIELCNETMIIMDWIDELIWLFDEMNWILWWDDWDLLLWQCGSLIDFCDELVELS